MNRHESIINWYYDRINCDIIRLKDWTINLKMKRKNCTKSKNEDQNWKDKVVTDDMYRFLGEKAYVTLSDSKKVIEFNDQYLIDANEQLLAYSCIIKK